MRPALVPDRKVGMKNVLVSRREESTEVKGRLPSPKDKREVKESGVSDDVRKERVNLTPVERHERG